MPITIPHPFQKTIVYFNEVKQHFYNEDNVNRILPPEFHPIFTTEDENSLKDFIAFFGAKFYADKKLGTFTKLTYVLDTYKEYKEQDSTPNNANLQEVSSLNAAV